MKKPKDKNGVHAKEGTILSEDGGLVTGKVTFKEGDFYVTLRYKGNKENKEGWGLRNHNHNLGEYLVRDRIRNYGAIFLVPKTCEKCQDKEKPTSVYTREFPTNFIENRSFCKSCVRELRKKYTVKSWRKIA